MAEGPWIQTTPITNLMVPAKGTKSSTTRGTVLTHVCMSNMLITSREHPLCAEAMLCSAQSWSNYSSNNSSRCESFRNDRCFPLISHLTHTRAPGGTQGRCLHHLAQRGEGPSLLEAAEPDRSPAFIRAQTHTHTTCLLAQRRLLVERQSRHSRNAWRMNAEFTENTEFKMKHSWGHDHSPEVQFSLELLVALRNS